MNQDSGDSAATVTFGIPAAVAAGDSPDTSGSGQGMEVVSLAQVAGLAGINCQTRL